MTRERRLAQLRELLDTASALADAGAADETNASDTFTHIAQQIDNALAAVETAQ